MRYRFEGFELLAQERRLLAGNAPVSIGARAFDVLLTLVAHHDRVVTKGELLESVWPGLMVEENNLQVQISSLRRVLGPQAIATIPGRGYRLAMRVRSEAADAKMDANDAAVRQLPPAAETGPRRNSNLPGALPPLYGRNAELAQLCALLDGHRTVALVAAGGVGKTHLARAVADTRRAMHPDGVWVIDLAELARGDLVAPAVLQALGFQVAPGQTPLGTAVDVLRRQDALLLLDNCEHVLEAVASLVQAVNDAAPRVRVLVTSQAPLRCTHERVFRLDTLSLPSSPALGDVQRSGAVQLLVHRIQAAAPNFELTEANAARVAALCQRLDGIALALELAAARVPLLGLDGLLARLDERFEVLTGGSRLKLKRHQTLRAALAFSHSLLTADEQAVFRRLGAFAGSFSADCAQEVASDAALDRWAVLDHLGALVDKSFVLADAGDPPRLRLLETTRAYALESLAQAGETAAVLERHARVFAQLLEVAAQDYWLLSDAAMLERYWPDQANLRAAMDWTLAHDPELAVRMVGDAGPLWREALSQQPEGARYCAAALACVGERTPPLAHGRLLHTCAWMLIWSQQQRARATAHQAAALLRQADDPATLGMTLLLLIPGTTAPDAQQEAVLDEMRRLHDPQAPPRVRAQLLSASARLAMGACRYDEAMELYGQARALLSACGATQWEGVLAWTMGSIAITTRELDFAVGTLRDTASRLDALPTRGIFLAFSLGSLATALLFRSDTQAAREALTRAAPLIVRYDLGSRYAATAACLAAQERRWSSAAMLLGYGQAASSVSGVDAEEPAELRARSRVMQHLAANATAAQVAAWMAAGSAMETEAAYALALEHAGGCTVASPR